MIQVLKASQNKGEIGEVQSNEHEQLKKKLVFRNSGTSWNKIWKGNFMNQVLVSIKAVPKP